MNGHPVEGAAVELRTDGINQVVEMGIADKDRERPIAWAAHLEIKLSAHAQHGIADRFTFQSPQRKMPEQAIFSIDLEGRNLLPFGSSSAFCSLRIRWFPGSCFSALLVSA